MVDFASVRAIDFHTHAEEPCGCHADDGYDDLQAAMANYFGAPWAHPPTMQETAAHYRAQNIAAVIFPVDAERETGYRRYSNYEVAEACAKNDDILIPFASIDPHKGKIGAREARDLVENGLALWENAGERGERLMVRGQANLIEAGGESLNLDRIRTLFDDLERKRDIADFLELTESGEGVRIFIGSENKLFSLSGSSLVVSPYMNADRQIIGAVGVIGPTRLNYGRIVPIVDYTAQLVGKLLSERGRG